METFLNIVPIAEQSMGARFINKLTGTKACAHCGEPLTLTRRLTGRLFCCAAHEEVSRQKRVRHIESLLDKADMAPTSLIPRPSAFLLPQAAAAAGASDFRLAPRSGCWTRPHRMRRLAVEVPPGDLFESSECLVRGTEAEVRWNSIN